MSTTDVSGTALGMMIANVPAVTMDDQIKGILTVNAIDDRIDFFR
jgi:hypothetical protein